MRFLWLVWLTQGCAYISDKHEDWRLDPDDDGVGIVEDCDSNDASVGAERAWYRDVDEDGFGDEADVTYGCDRPDGYAAEPGDCDDTDSTISPRPLRSVMAQTTTATARRMTVSLCRRSMEDMDGDGFGDPSAAVQACGAIEGLVDNGNDCDDTNRFMQEQRTIETHYNGIDDNCDISDGDGDADGDGHWAEDYVAQLEGLGIEPMPAPEGMGDDCNDDDDTVFRVRMTPGTTGWTPTAAVRTTATSTATAMSRARAYADRPTGTRPTATTITPTSILARSRSAAR